MPFQPRFSYHDHLVDQLMEIARHREFSDHVAIGAVADLRLRRQARQRSTHSSTAIEGNPLSQQSLPHALSSRAKNPSLAQQEVRNYWRALEWIDERVSEGTPLSEDLVRRLHAIIFSGGRGRPKEFSSYRSEQMMVRDTRTGGIEYIAPEPLDVPDLMSGLLEWWSSPDSASLPAPLRAGILAYRFVTIHPFVDGNGRTTRALATYALWQSGYSFRGYLSLEDYYAQDLPAYYGALQMGLHHNYYLGRHDPDLTPWLDYFVQTLLMGAREVRAATERALPQRDSAPRQPLARRLENLVLRSLVAAAAENRSEPLVDAGDVAEWFGISPRTAREWLREWADQGHLIPSSGQARVTAWRYTGPLAETIQEALAQGLDDGLAPQIAEVLSQK